MTVLAVAVKVPVRSLSWLPDAVRPGLFLAGTGLLVWLVATRAAVLWHGALRGLAVAVDAVVGAALLPEFALTSLRRERGRGPGPATLVVGNVADRILVAAAALHERHAGRPQPQESAPTIPYRFVAVALLVPLCAWLAMDQLPDSPIAGLVDRFWAYWNDVEAWAGVPS